MISDPWKELVPSHSADTVSAKRVHADLTWDFFWAIDFHGKRLLVLRHNPESSAGVVPPKLRGMEISLLPPREGHPATLTFQLVDAAQRDIFEKLCSDIVSATAQAATEKEAVATAIARTWRWHYLLRGGSDRRLSPEEQKGLIGELLFIERHLLPIFAPNVALSAWNGPLGAPKDFEIHAVGIEVKARRAGATPVVAISSEHQLDDAGLKTLFLYVVDLSEASPEDKGSMTITDVASRVRDHILLVDPGAAMRLEELLSAAGLLWENDYSDHVWIEGTNRVFVVRAGFPRITGANLDPGVMNVKYAVALAACQPFMTTEEALRTMLTGATDGNGF